MNRVGDYIRFAVWFTGLGYVALWALSASVGSLSLALSPGLHLAGMTASALVAISLLLRPLRRRRRRPAAIKAALPIEPAPLRVRLQFGSKAAPPPRRYVKPRSHFGLRNAPH